MKFLISDSTELPKKFGKWYYFTSGVIKEKLIKNKLCIYFGYTIEKTIEYSKWLDTFVAQFFINTPFPGTLDYERNKDNLIESDWEKFDCYTPVVNNRNITPQQLLNLKEKAFVSYYYRPKYAWKFVNRFFS